MADDQFRDPAQRALGAWTPQCLSAAEMARLTSAAGGETGPELDHVATCDYCAAQLKLLIEMKTTSLAPEEEQVMRVLERSAPQAQARAVQKFRKSSGKPPWQPWAIAAGVILAVGSATVWWRYSEDPARQSSRLLAEAYTARRTFDWRLPDTGWTQRETQRGGVVQRPTPLLDAEALLARGGDRENDPQWLDLRARAEILDLQFDSAIMLLQRAIQLSPKSADLLADLAVAYGLSAESQDRPEQFAAAVEFSTRALAIDPQNRRALFNRALAFERLYMVDRAIEDWEQYLKIETDPAWAKEARAHLDQLRATQHKRARLMESDEESDAVLEQKAVRWLKEDRAKARAVGKLLLQKYGDRWLADAAEEPVDSGPLWRVENDIAANRANPALQESHEAMRLYSRLGAPAHLARIRFAAAAALNRSMHAAECNVLASELIRSASERKYQWIRVEALLERSTCSLMAGDLSQAKQERLEAIRVARQYQIAGLISRAVGIDASYATATGDLWAAWRDNRNALGELAASPYSAVRIQQCLSNYSASAESWGWRAASFQFIEAAAHSLQNTTNHIAEAANRARAASLALQSGLSREYREQAERAQELFRQLPESETRTRYLNSVELLEGEAYLTAGRPADAVRTLTPVAQAVVLQREQWRAHQLLGLSLLRTNRPEIAIPQLEDGVTILERRIGTLPRLSERSYARRGGLEAYRSLAQALLDRDLSGAQSLRVWLSAHGSTTAPDVVFLALDTGYAVWTGNGSRVHRLVLDRSQMRQSIARLLTAASDPRRPAEEISREGRFLFDWLLRPLLPELPLKGVLTILPDAEIAAIPFQLLVERDGGWWSDHLATVFAAHRANGGEHWSAPQRALVVGSPATREKLPPLPESAREAEFVASRFPQSTLLTGRYATVNAVKKGIQHAELFHYSGHGYAGESVGGLYLADTLLTSISLRDVAPPSIRLAVLSACLTAVGQTDGLAKPDGLVHALLDTGTQTVIASRWFVDSAATAELMSALYSALTETGNPAESLRRASQQLRNEPRYQHPYYWAPFQTYE